MIYPWGDTRRFNSFSNRCKQKFGTRVQKVSVNAGFTCPNRDGTLSINGCTFCNNKAFNPVFSYTEPHESLSSQIDKGLAFIKKRYKHSAIFIAYFQSYSNTYGNLEVLKEKYTSALQHPEISGLSIGTRPDCIDDEKLLYLKELSEKYFISVEYGIESCNDESLKRINRGHDFKASYDAVKITAEMGIHTGAHFIFGLPGESKDELLKQADIISEMPLNSIKIHQLQIVKDTMLAEEFARSPESFHFFELPEYVELVALFLERLNPSISIERLSGEVPPLFNAGKKWGMVRSDKILSMVENKLEEMNSWQGKKFNSNL